MKERLKIIKQGQRIGYRPGTIDGTLDFIEKYRLNFMGKKPEVISAVSYRIMGLACGDPHTWQDIFDEIDVEPRYASVVYRQLLDFKSKRLKEIGITKKQLENKVRSFILRQNNGSSDEDRKEISEIFRNIFLG
ncbi:hypothetical protein A3K64_03185 [Candidatus Micrarchaeota archaeon RBG_16_36_9]|nr:MAG: hypothetical protein A3K64_03185 [Candidatus Micrarchaeota archaeon RBG_16_36_9]